MKRLFIILLVFAISISAQSRKDLTNSTDVVLDSAATFTPSVWKDVTAYNTVTISIKSDRNSATSGVKIKFATYVSGVYRVVDSTITSYTTGTLFKLTLPITAPYMQVIYTNTTTAQTYFSLVTMLNVGDVLPRDSNGIIKTTVTGGDTGNLLITPYMAYARTTDTWGAAKDTTIFDFANNYLVCYVTINNSSATADTLTLEVYSYAKGAYTIQMIGFRDCASGFNEVDNTTIVIPGNTAKKFEITKYRPGQIRVRPKTLTGRTVIKTNRVVTEGIN